MSCIFAPPPSQTLSLSLSFSRLIRRVSFFYPRIFVEFFHASLLQPLALEDYHLQQVVSVANLDFTVFARKNICLSPMIRTLIECFRAQ